MRRLVRRFEFIVVGVAAILLGIATLTVWPFNMPVASSGGRDLGLWWIIGEWLVFCGLGVILGNRFAAIALGVPLAATWVLQIVAAMVEPNVFGALMIIAFEWFFAVPLVLTVAGWRILGWRTWQSAA